MRQFLAVTAFSALLFCGFAVPCNAEISLVFSNNGSTNTGTDISTTPGTTGVNTVLDLTAIYNTLTVMGATGSPFTSLFLNEYYCTTSAYCSDIFQPSAPINTIVLVGSVDGVTGTLGGTGSSAPLVTISLSGALTGNVPGVPSGTFSLISPTDVSSISVNTALLTALGLTGATPSLSSMTDVTSGGSGGSYTVTSSATIDLGSPVSGTPEPGTWLMMTIGTSLVVFGVRRRSSRV